MNHKWIGSPEFVSSSKTNRHFRHSQNNSTYDKSEEKITSADLYLQENLINIFSNRISEKEHSKNEIKN